MTGMERVSFDILMPAGGLVFLTRNIRSRKEIQLARRYAFRRHNLMFNEAIGGETHRLENVRWIVNGRQRTVFWVQPRSGTDPLIDRILRFFRSIESPRATWSLAPPTGPTDIRARLAARGFEWLDTPGTAMWLDTKDIELKPSVPRDVSLRKVPRHSQAEVADVPYYDAETTKASRRAMDVMAEEYVLYEASDENGIVGHAHVHVQKGRYGIATLHDVGVADRARGRGIGRALTYAVCRDAVEAGCRYVGTNASEEGFHLYSRVGFVPVGPNEVMIVHNRLLNSPPPKREQEIVAAVGRGHVSTVKRLLRGRGVSLEFSVKPSALELATKIAGSDRMAAFLLEAGEDPNGKPGREGRPLLYAAERGMKATVRRLLERGADVSLAVRGGSTAAEVAADRGHRGAARALGS